MVADLADESRFAKHLAPGVKALRGIGGDGLFTAYNSEPNWAKAHNLLAPAFSQTAMRSYHRTMLDVAGELVAHWDRHGTGSPIDVSADMTKLTLETIGRTGFSYSFDSFEREEQHPFVKAMIGTLSHSQRTTIIKSTAVGRYLALRSHERDENRKAYMADVVDEVILTRRENPGGAHEDLLELMLRAAKENDPNRIDELNIRHQVVTFLVAGHETTSGALSFALYYLSQNPEVLAKAQAEVDAVWGTEEPPFEKIAKLRYVRRVLDESLRLWPTAPAYARAARQDTTLIGKYPMK
jgi:unspecific monooxygenase